MRYITAGESHGPELTAIVYDVPAGLGVSEHDINVDLARRQGGYGRGGRQQIEHDTVRITSGVRFGKTIGAPVTMTIANRDFANWETTMAAFGDPPEDLQREVQPRPGHADLVGVLKNNTDDCRNVLERASARETAARVAAAGIAKEFLAELGIDIVSFTCAIGNVAIPREEALKRAPFFTPLEIETSDVRCPYPDISQAMCARIDDAEAKGESLGGLFMVVATGLLPGLGGYATPTDRLTSQLGAALFSIPAVKGVEFGLGFESARRFGSDVHDAIVQYPSEGFSRETNNAGGLEGGMTTGMPLIITCAMKPIPTMRKPLSTVNLDTLEPCEASKERSDICAVPSAAVVAEAEVAFVLAKACMDKFGSDNMADIRAAFRAYKNRVWMVSH